MLVMMRLWFCWLAADVSHFFVGITNKKILKYRGGEANEVEREEV
jgi:hypothetical protein